MAKGGGRGGQRAALERKPVGRGGSLFTGLFMGLAAGLVIAAVLAWYFYTRPSDFKAPDVPAHEEPVNVEPPPVASHEPPPMEISPPPPLPKTAPRATKPVIPGPEKETKPADPGYSFYDILPGDKPAKPQDMQLPREVWWLQVAALREQKDANALKAKLSLLGLDVKVNQVDSAAGPLHRIRVGPFKTEDEALGALDTLAVNNYEPRLFKEKLNP